MTGLLLKRYSAFIICGLLFLLSFIHLELLWPLTIIAGALCLLGVYDLRQTRHAVRRNYPISGNLRYLFESMRPALRQYLFETDTEQLPFSRAQRSLVYARAKNESSERPFGTQKDVNQSGYEFISHTMLPVTPGDPAEFRVLIGNQQCSQPYSASVFNISAMSFGSLSANAILSLNKGAKLGGFAHDTGEGSISPYHLEHGGDLIWELGSGYFGCRDAHGQFDPTRFAAQASRAQVKMIELKLSQGAKPGHGGILPKEKITPEIAATRGIPMDKDCISPARHSTFSTPIELLEFLQQLRTLSGGKPVGFKLCLGYPWEFMAIVKAMLKTGIVPDFIVVDGKEGGTGAAPLEFTNHIGVPLREAVMFVHNTLTGAGLREQIRIGASGKLISAFDIASVIALGADWANSARGFMFAVGCIQSQVCHTNTCPVGVATQDPRLQKALVVSDKARRVYNFHHNTMHALAELLSAAGLSHPAQLEPRFLVHREANSELRPYNQLHVYLEKNALLAGNLTDSFYQRMWAKAQAESFSAQAITGE